MFRPAPSFRARLQAVVQTASQAWTDEVRPDPERLTYAQVQAILPPW
jgi:hypothetical protein